MDYSELKKQHERLLSEYAELSKQYHTATTQLGALTILQNDILQVADRLKAI
jgi:hypothetical protein